MKKTRMTVLIGAFVICLWCLGASNIPPGVVKTVTSSSTPEQLTTNSLTTFKTIVLMGYKAARTVNVGTVYVQTVSTNDAPAIPITSGQVVSLTVSSPGMSTDDLWIDVANNADGVMYFVFQ